MLSLHLRIAVFELADLAGFYEKLRNVSPNADWYSNPGNMGTLPFPFLFCHLPERFQLLDNPPGCDFEYIGRESFASVWETVGKLRLPAGRGRIYIHGTMGYGKSHILAALACLLAREGKRVVYVPDCRQMLNAPLLYLKSALLCAFPDPPSFRDRIAIRACSSVQHLLQFCQARQDRWYFIIDQRNALDPEELGQDMASNSAKTEWSAVLLEMAVTHYSITSASANHKTVKHMRQKQTGDLKLSLMGGMSEVRRVFVSLCNYLTLFLQEEMKYWWLHQGTKVPVFEDEADKDRVEDLTGRIPLLLQPLLASKGLAFSKMEDTFWKETDLINVERNITGFADRMRISKGTNYYA